MSSGAMRVLTAAAIILLLPVLTGAQTQGGHPPSVPDLNGLWQSPYTPDLERAYGKPLPHTPFGAEQFKKRNLLDDPTGFCLPVGPARGIQAPFPFQIVQTKDVVALLFEYQRVFRLIYMDGRKAPDDIFDYPEWMGYSTGRYEGDTLVVETIATDERTWLDTAGHEHSAKLRLTERFRKASPDSIEWSVTFDDPVYFTEPWTVTRPLGRRAASDRIMSYSCQENEKDTSQRE